MASGMTHPKVGILGGGQLARMLALSGAPLGLRFLVMDNVTDACAGQFAPMVVGDYRDEAALTEFASKVDVATFDFENVPAESAHWLSDRVTVFPNPRALAIAQDRLAEKTLFVELGIPVPPFAAIDTREQLGAALDRIGTPCILKTRRLGYDGKGQASVAPGEDVAAAWERIGALPAILEGRIAFALELSALVVRGPAGELAFYDCPHNTHADGILRRSVVPSGLPEADLARARDIAGTIAAALDYVGVLAVEMFYLGTEAAPEDRLMVNEIAPRVHNSGHWTIEACAISQFENHMRAVAGWPLGSAERHSDAEMVNLIGKEALDWPRLAAEPGACLHLYGKRDARPGRKMGHVTRLFAKTADRV